MNTPKNCSHTHKISYALVPAILVLAAAVTIISTSYPTAPGTQVRKPSSLRRAPTMKADPIQPECQALSECSYIQMHTTGQSTASGGPENIASGPVLTPECDGLPKCGYIRMHIQADRGTQP